jgi:hypothetical protein
MLWGHRHICGPSLTEMRRNPVQGVQLTCVTPNTAERDRPQHDHPAARCIAQQYSSATAVALSSHSREEKHSARVSSLSNCFYSFKTAFD